MSDTGIGVPADKQKRIFEPFTQADNTTTRVYGGTGLGLAISKRLVELMGGRIWVESRAGRRFAFSFYSLAYRLHGRPVPAPNRFRAP